MGESGVILVKLVWIDRVEVYCQMSDLVEMYRQMSDLVEVCCQIWGSGSHTPTIRRL